MKFKHVVRFTEMKKVAGNERGFILIAALTLLATLTLVGTTAYIVSSTDIRIGGTFKNNQEVFQAALAGVEHGRETLRVLNAGSSDPTSFNDELENASGGPPPVGNGTFELDAYGSDDNALPLAGSTSLGKASYVVYLTNDAVDSAAPISDSNNRVLLTSIATNANGSRAVVEVSVSLPPPPAAPPPASIPVPVSTVGLLGNSASFIGGNSNAKSLNGDDQCGSNAPQPVVAVSNSGSVGSIQSEINGSKPQTYHTKLADGTPVDASTHMNDIARAMTAAEMNNNNGVDLTSAASLNSMVDAIASGAQTIPASGGSNTGSVNLGTVADPKVVVVDGDFTMNAGSSGAGMLVVKGQLTFAGDVDYTGIIMVIGKGTMIRDGGGNGTISGAVWVANTAGLDGIPGTADDAMGMSILNTSGGGSSNIQFCSSAVNNAAAAISAPPPPPSNSPLTVSSFRQIL